MTTSESNSNNPISLWFPFTKEELGLGLGVIGFVLTILTLADVQKPYLVGFAGGSLLLSYLGGLLVYNRRESQKFVFVQNGGISGLGYLPYFKRAKHSLLLTHVDDDAPGEELNHLYKKLLNSGVQMRRLIFMRDDAPDTAYQWIKNFGGHDNLHYRLIRPDHSKAMRFSFVVVDESVVIVSVPGYETLDAVQYNDQFILRHVFVIKDSEAAKVFSRMHADLWADGVPLGDVAEMDAPQDVIQKLNANARSESAS